MDVAVLHELQFYVHAHIRVCIVTFNLLAYFMKFFMHIVPLKATQMLYISDSQVSNNSMMNVGICGVGMGGCH
jgi:hypothetical protein